MEKAAQNNQKNWFSYGLFIYSFYHTWTGKRGSPCETGDSWVVEDGSKLQTVTGEGEIERNATFHFIKKKKSEKNQYISFYLFFLFIDRSFTSPYEQNKTLSRKAYFPA